MCLSWLDQAKFKDKHRYMCLRVTYCYFSRESTDKRFCPLMVGLVETLSVGLVEKLSNLHFFLY